MQPLHRPVIAPSMMLVILCCCLQALSSHAQVYRCGNNYSMTPCTDAKIVDIAPAAQTSTVTAQVTTSQRHAESKNRQEARDWDRIERELDKAEAASPPKRNNDNNSAECAAASRRIQKIDELARKGGSARKMEKLREDRQATRDKQFRMGC